jgi:hypothetical protein
MIRMQYSSNCPAVPEYFDPAKLAYHTKPVYHSDMQWPDYPAACLWAQLQWERERNDGGRQYPENLQAEWQRRDLCSDCMRGLDHPFMTEVIA